MRWSHTLCNSHTLCKMKVHLFNPENDLALGIGCRNYTPPPHAAALHRAGTLMPLWWADEGDAVIAPEGLEKEARELCRRYGLHGRIFAAEPTPGAEAAPWGWSADAKRQFMIAGMDEGGLPDDKHIELLRNLSHRRMSIEIIKGLGADYPMPVEATDADVVVKMEKENPGCFVKSPWSCSGRGVFCAQSLDATALRKRVEGMINRQGSVMVEKGLDKVVDFAALFRSADGRVRFEGLSVFMAENRGAYSGNIVAPQKVLRSYLARFINLEQLDETIRELESVLSGLIGKEYQGYAGIDMMVYREDGEYKVMPCVELNLRMTMGVAAMKIHERLGGEETRLLRWELGLSDDELRRRESAGELLLPPSDGFALTVSPILL